MATCYAVVCLCVLEFARGAAAIRQLRLSPYSIVVYCEADHKCTCPTICMIVSAIMMQTSGGKREQH